MLGDYHRVEQDSLDWIQTERKPASYICRPVTILGSLLPYKTEHTMSRLEALFSPSVRNRPAFIVSPKLGLNALHFAVAELYESFNEWRSRMDGISGSVLADAPLAFMLQNFFSSEQVNHADNDGWTALHIAALNSNIRATALLLEAGGNPNLCTKGQWTVLDCANIAKVKSGRWTIVTATAENISLLRVRTDAVIELLKSKGAESRQKIGLLIKMKAMTFMKEWRFYTYLDATKL